MPVLPPLILPDVILSVIGLPVKANGPDGVPAIVPATDVNVAPVLAPGGSGPEASAASWSADRSSQRNSVMSRAVGQSFPSSPAETCLHEVRFHVARVVDRLVEIVDVLGGFLDDIGLEQLPDFVMVQRVDGVLLRVE